jgi:23S rRNA pseudouridine1911/1915/1917 synthase
MTDLGKLTPKRHTHIYGPKTPETLENHLAATITEYSQDYFRWLIEFGAVYVNHKRQTLRTTPVHAEDVIRVHFSPKRYPLDRQDLKARIIHENDEFIIVDKPSGLPMHPTLDNLAENLIAGFATQLFVTHRLDVPTSGLVLLAKTKEYQKLFNQLLTDRKVSKLYVASVEKNIPPQEVVHYMLDSVRAPKEVFLTPPVGTKSFECRLILRSTKKISNNNYELEIQLLTGRTHQIRAQLSALGAPILGDEMYGGSPATTFGLRAVSLSFVCPLKGTPYFFQ